MIEKFETSHPRMLPSGITMVSAARSTIGSNDSKELRLDMGGGDELLKKLRRCLPVKRIPELRRDAVLRRSLEAFRLRPDVKEG